MSKKYSPYIAINAELEYQKSHPEHRLSNAEPPPVTSASSALWQPIRTAKWGHRLLLIDLDDKWPYIGRWNEHLGDDGLWEEEDGSLPDEQPTHWLPLPEPPVAGEAGGGASHKTNPKETGGGGE